MEGELIFICKERYWGGDYDVRYTVNVESIITEGGEVSFIGTDSNGHKKDFAVTSIARKYECSSRFSDERLVKTTV